MIAWVYDLKLRKILLTYPKVHIIIVQYLPRSRILDPIDPVRARAFWASDRKYSSVGFPLTITLRIQFTLDIVGNAVETIPVQFRAWETKSIRYSRRIGISGGWPGHSKRFETNSTGRIRGHSLRSSRELWQSCKIFFFVNYNNRRKRRDSIPRILFPRTRVLSVLWESRRLSPCYETFIARKFDASVCDSP